MQKGVFFRWVHRQVIFARTAGVYKFQNNVFAYAFEVAPAPGFKRIGGGRTPTLFHGPIISATCGVRFHLISGPPHDVHASAVGLPPRDARSKVLIGIRDSAVML